jgi:hypothetical protein
MNEIPPPPGSPPTPIDPRPFAPGSPKQASGCQRPLLIGCGTLALLLGIGAIVFVVKAKSVLAFAMGQLRSQVVAQLPLDTTDAEREHLESAFEEAIGRIREGKIDPEGLQSLQKQLVSAAQAGGERRMSRTQLEELLQSLDTFNGHLPAAPAEPAAPAAEPAPPAAATTTS